ncbi:MAG: hypothetical protein E6K73_07665 [Candidatus Eisenbacteria bacterium]|uniref:Ig-like domain-containing protein n=1 Tax=Eiseniibacteriota bacterium TaxID=2212470 RepID=A0A538SGP9_UNCEI|nr:MAG: hypothetical protein E6K73_07665 [Candidatus Eisenbacteria bacterium]
MHLDKTTRNPHPKLVLGIATTALLIMSASPPMARANDLSGSPCTAGDVELVGSGQIVNEPCSCPPGTMFNAQVKFTVRNNTSSARYCVALHLVPDGVLITAPLDVILRDANGSSTAGGKTGKENYHDTVMFGSIPNFTCSTGLVCFGQAGAVQGKCSPNTCTTISWNTSSGAAGCTAADQNPPGGQCRHQQVCVIGYGASLSCTANCTVSCGTTATLQGCVKSPTNRGPFTLALAGNDGSSQTQSTFGDPSGNTCLNFSVTPSKSPTTIYTLTVTDKDGCTRTATTSLDVRAHPTAGAGPDQAKCSAGATTSFTLAGSASNGTPAWSVVSGPVTIADSSSPTSGATFTGTGTATLRITVSNPPCPPATDEVVLAVNSNPTANAGLDQTQCAAGATTPFTLAGSATSGTPTWSVVSGPATIASPGSLTSGVTLTGTGTATLRLTVASTANPPCPSATDEVVLVVNGNPAADAGLDQTRCAAGSTTPFTVAGSATNGTPTWSVMSGPATIADPSSLSSGVTFTGTGTATLRMTVVSTANPPCPTATDEVVLAVNGNPTSDAGPDQVTCAAGETTPFTLAGSATNGTPTWSVVSGPVTIADPGSLSSGATFTGSGTATLRLTVVSTANPACPTATDEVTLTVNSNPTANAGPDQTTCSTGATTSFALAGSATNGTPTWSVVSGPVTIADPGSLSSGATFTGSGTATLRLTVSSIANPPCPAATDEVTLNVTQKMVIITPLATTACNGVLRYAASVDGRADCAFTWTIDGLSLKLFLGGGSPDDARLARVSGTNNSILEFRALDNACHTIAVAASCPSGTGSQCPATASTTASQCVNSRPTCQ